MENPHFKQLKQEFPEYEHILESLCDNQHEGALDSEKLQCHKLRELAIELVTTLDKAPDCPSLSWIIDVDQLKTGAAVEVISPNFLTATFGRKFHMKLLKSEGELHVA